MRRLICFVLTLALLASGRVLAQDASISTNLVDYAQLGTLNLEASCGVARHWSLNAGVKYNPFSFENEELQSPMQSRQRSVALGTRYWPWHIY